jgi:hypothetical protein
VKQYSSRGTERAACFVAQQNRITAERSRDRTTVARTMRNTQTHCAVLPSALGRIKQNAKGSTEGEAVGFGSGTALERLEANSACVQRPSWHDMTWRGLTKLCTNCIALTAAVTLNTRAEGRASEH